MAGFCFFFFSFKIFPLKSCVIEFRLHRQSQWQRKRCSVYSCRINVLYSKCNPVILPRYFISPAELEQYTLLEINKPMAGYQLKADKCCLLCPVYHMVTLIHLKLSTATKPLTSCVFSLSDILSLLPHFDWAWDVLPSCISVFPHTVEQTIHRSKKTRLANARLPHYNPLAERLTWCRQSLPLPQ